MKLKVALLCGLAVVAASTAAFFYWIYAPHAEPPALSGTWVPATMPVGEQVRSYATYTPQPAPQHPGILLVLHGTTSTGAQIRRWTGYEFDALADQQGLIVVYPDGYKKAWNDCRKTGPAAAKQENVDDVGFLAQIIHHLVSEAGANAQSVYLFGYSNGGQMALRMALERPTEVTKIALVGANLPVPDDNACPQTGPTCPVMLINGTQDPITPFGGGEVTLFGFSSRGSVLSAVQTGLILAQRNGLEAPPRLADVVHRDANDPTHVESRTWLHGGIAYVQQFIVQGGGHVVPQPRFRFPRMLGATNHDLDAPAEAVKFFLSRG